MKGKWSIAEARQRFAELIESTAREPQPIYKRGTMVAAMVDAETFLEFLKWKEEQAGRTIDTAMEELRALCEEEGYEFAWPKRGDRPNPFSPESRS
jgi:prevent-host-death family protein